MPADEFLSNWPSWKNQSAGIAIANLDNNGATDLIVFSGRRLVTLQGTPSVASWVHLGPQ